MKKFLLTLCSLPALMADSAAQDFVAPAACRSSEMIEEYYRVHPQAGTEQAANEAFTSRFMEAMQMAKSSAVDTYRIALVFHVYGNVQGGQTVSEAVIKDAVARLNDDFHGLNSDYSQVHPQFMALRSKKNIKFCLAKKDPNGNPTNGIVYYPAKSGYGNAVGYDSDIAAEAWDNYKYVNVYVQHDLYNDGFVFNSGVAWYPNSYMSDNGLARIVYNGAYLASNSADPEFASVLTHEFGHFFNLIHTFDGGCTIPNDNVADTPPCTQGQGCHTGSNMSPMNCNSQLVNADNYMDYNICYKMFTQGQTTRMEAALQMPSRKTLWQDTTLEATGILEPTEIALKSTNSGRFKVYPNPSSGIIQIETGRIQGGHCQVNLTDIAGKTLLSRNLVADEEKLQIDLSTYQAGIYFVRFSNAEFSETVRLRLQ